MHVNAEELILNVYRWMYVYSVCVHRGTSQCSHCVCTPAMCPGCLQRLDLAGRMSGLGAREGMMGRSLGTMTQPRDTETFLGRMCGSGSRGDERVSGTSPHAWSQGLELVAPIIQCL